VTRWLMIGVGLALSAGEASAAPPLAMRAPDLRLPEPGYQPPVATRRLGMIADRQLAPNARLGLGLMSSTSKATGSEGRRSGKSRKLGLSFQLQF